MAPTARERDEKEQYEPQIFKAMAELGLTGIPWPEKYGGIGSDYLAYAITIEELARVCASLVMLSAHTSLAGWPIYQFGTEVQKQRYLKPLGLGEKVGAYGPTEPSSGSDAGGMKTTARIEGNHYVLNGSKIFITNGGIADIYIVFALTDSADEAKGDNGIYCRKGYSRFFNWKKGKETRNPFFSNNRDYF